MTSRPPPRIPVIATAASQAIIDHPSFHHALDNWRARGMKIVVVVPRSAKLTEPTGIRIIRHTSEEPMLVDVIGWAARSIDSLHPYAVICDPLVVMSRGIMRAFEPAFVARHNLGNAWACTSTARILNARGDPEADEERYLQWFACAANTTRMMLTSSAGPIESNVPFTPAIWSGVVAGWLQRRVTEARYHNISDLRAVGSAMPVPAELPDVIGYEQWTGNAPTRRYPEMTPPKPVPLPAA